MFNVLPTQETIMTASTTRLQPTIVATFVEAGDTLFDGIRRRPVAAYTNDGRAVVCCARTARRNGWTIVARAWKR